MPFIQTQGPTTILVATGRSSNQTTGTTNYQGDWYQIHPKLGRIAVHAILATSSVGATAGSTVRIEVSNSTAYGAAATKPVSLALTATTDLVSDGAVFSTSMSGQWGFIRADINSLTTSTAGSTGQGPVVRVIVNAAPVAAGP